MKNLTNNKRVNNVECTKDGNQGITLYYEIDGKPFTVTGEFYIDKNGVLHHSAIDPTNENEEIEIMVQYKENIMKTTNNKTLEAIAQYYNNEEDINMMELEKMIEDAGFISDLAQEFGICHSDDEKVIIDDNGKAFVTSL